METLEPCFDEGSRSALGAATAKHSGGEKGAISRRGSEGEKEALNGVGTRERNWKVHASSTALTLS